MGQQWEGMPRLEEVVCTPPHIAIVLMIDGRKSTILRYRTFSGEEKILMILSKGSCREGQDPEGSVLVTDAER